MWLDERFARVDERFDKLEADMDQRFADEREERRAEMQTLRQELRADFAHDIGVSLEDFERSQRLAYVRSGVARAARRAVRWSVGWDLRSVR